MSGTTQMVRPKEVTGTWTSTFPNEINTEAQSKLFMKKLIAVAISSITYLRAIFPEFAFCDRHVEGLKLKILNESNGCPGACQVIKWIKGSFDALEKKYLRQIMIGVYLDPDQPDNVIEGYTFRFSYEQDSTTVKCNDNMVASIPNNGIEFTKKATVSLLRTIIMLMQSLDPLPDSAFLTMKLLYYDEVTPWNYEPPGFKPADTDCFYFKHEPLNIRVGEVATRFHCLKLRIKTDKMKFDVDEEELPLDDASSIKTDKTKFDPEEKEQPIGGVSSKVNNLHDSLNHFKETSTETTVNEKSLPASHEFKNDREQSSNPSKTVLQNEPGNVECPCGSNEENSLLMTCALCATRQHSVCFGILREEDIPEKHICEECSDANNPDRQSTDEYLATLPSVEQQVLCLWRKTLLLASESNTLNSNTLVRKLDVEKDVAKSLLDRLVEQEYASKGKGKNKGKIVVCKERVLSVGFPTYMKISTCSLAARTQKERSHNNVANKEIEQLTDQANSLMVSEPQQLAQYLVTQRRKRRAVNREEGCEFDISDSQDTSAGFEMKPKRKKSSVCGEGLAF